MRRSAHCGGLEHRAATLARLQRVNEALSAWDEYEAARALPDDVRPAVEPPAVSRQTLKDLQAELVAWLGVLEEVWELRHLRAGTWRRQKLRVLRASMHGRTGSRNRRLRAPDTRRAQCRIL